MADTYIQHLERLRRQPKRQLPPTTGPVMTARDPSLRDMATDVIGSTLEAIGYPGGRLSSQAKARDAMGLVDMTPAGGVIGMIDNPTDPVNIASMAAPALGKIAKAIPDEAQRKLEDIIYKYATGEKTAAQVRKMVEREVPGYRIDSLKGKYGDVPIEGPDGSIFYIGG